MVICIKTLVLVMLVSLMFLSSCSEPVKPVKAVPSKLSSVTATEIQKYLQENFGISGAETTWYHNILDVSVQGDVVHVKTDLKPDNPNINKICGAVYNWFTFSDRLYVLEKIRISGVNGETINNRLNPENDKCWP